MAGSTFGTIFSITTWGESHGQALGVVIDGCPAGLSLDVSDIQVYLDRRKPGQSDITTPRKEDDKVEILSGLFEGKTTGTPISLMIRNTGQHSKDYDEIASYYRPGHADFTYDAKYGFRDARGGGRSSGRETIGRVASGAIAAKILGELGVSVEAYLHSIGPIKKTDQDADEKISKLINECKENGDSIGSCVECRISGLPAGIGEPVFEKLDANLSHAIMSIGAVKAVEIGDGCAVSSAYGLENNDSFINVDGNITKQTNKSGGILGGLSDGADIILRAFFKPTPSIKAKQQTVDRNGQSIEVQIEGRHDPVIAPRAVVVVESMAALTVLDMMLLNMSSKLDKIKLFYS